MSVVNAAEVVDVLVRRHGRAADEVVSAVDDLTALVPASADLALQAGELRARLFDRRSPRVSLADCFVLATAEQDRRDDRDHGRELLLGCRARRGTQVIRLGA